CNGCHFTPLAANPFGAQNQYLAGSPDMGAFWMFMGQDHDISLGYDPNLSVAMHRFHGELQWNADKSDIVREIRIGLDPTTGQNYPTGKFVRWDWKSTGKSNPNTLFPIHDAQGKQLPMEENCLKCHAGHREPLFRDRMFTAGRTCYDCHGDMLAVGQVFPKNYPANPSKLGSIAQSDYRMPWFDEPDCGSCHRGDANLGIDQPGFYSPGVMATAFDESDPSATPRAVDPAKPADMRFSAAATGNYQASFKTMLMALNPDYTVNPAFNASMIDFLVDAPLYRYGKDQHANLGCPACHGAAHAIGPNRDPKANDNVTAIQLQGYPGPIRECSVCHTRDAFATESSLGSALHYPDKLGQPTILAGPHNMHPVNDPNWWGRAAADTMPISDGTTWGGWHDNIYHKPGLKGEDQCAACHGADHKGTRLSRTPVDREFVVKNGKKARWKAGEFIGCDRCHSLEASFRGRPGSTAGNHNPVISSTPVTTGVIGQAYRYQVAANDPDGDPLSYRLSNEPGSVSIDKTGLVTTSWPTSLFSSYESGSFKVPYTVSVSDGKGGHAEQTVTVALTCPVGQVWIWDGHAGSCVATSRGAIITSTPPAATVVSGNTYSYQVTATDDKGLPLTYSLTSKPSGMNIDANGGLITWKTETWVSNKLTFRVTATNTQGGYGFQAVTVYVCPKGTKWSNSMGGGMCM
ncbi:MAG: putative Ig domain-containing protein, partial [Methylococcaceae bacterium]|nr:putative Ig domain-containing protein [Methylococcaceae bacterium]